METIFLAILAVIVLGGFYALFKALNSAQKERGQDQSLLMLQNQLQELNRTMQSQTGEVTKVIQTQHGQSTKIIQDVLGSTAQYELQYRLGVDEKTNKELIPDAVIFIGDRKLAIDAKFSLENYNKLVEERDPGIKEQLEKNFKQDIKNRIDETSKYVRPDLGTMDIAIMFIPAEGIFSDILGSTHGSGINAQDLLEYASRAKRG